MTFHRADGSEYCALDQQSEPIGTTDFDYDKVDAVLFGVDLTEEVTGIKQEDVDRALVVLEVLWIRRGDPNYYIHARYWSRLFMTTKLSPRSRRFTQSVSCA